jgi:flagellar biosynthesis/type III secretory pathway protein FliH
LLKKLTAGTRLNILTDANIKPGGLKIRTSQEEIDATLDSRWEVLNNFLFQKINKDK